MLVLPSVEVKEEVAMPMEQQLTEQQQHQPPGYNPGYQQPEYQPQVVVDMQPTPVTQTVQQESLVRGRFSSNIFDCFDDVPGCCLTCWCPCITYGQIVSSAKISTHCNPNGDCNTGAMVYIGVYIVVWILGYILSARMSSGFFGLVSNWGLNTLLGFILLILIFDLRQKFRAKLQIEVSNTVVSTDFYHC
jgi:Cys-rich protein (TIGR01571 family)